jgi:hypothetical protein
MELTLTRLALTVASASVLCIYGCGGGGGGTASTSSPTITGTAATGAALANAPVTVTNNAGTSPCAELTITTTALGSYTCTLKSGETAPFFIVITDPTGDKAPLVSIATSNPAAGTPLTVNATPLTTAIVGQLNTTTTGDALDFVNNRKGSYTKTALDTATTNVLAQLSPVLTQMGIPSYHPFTTSITAATAAGTGNTADQVLDIVKVTTNPATGALALSTIIDPTPVPMASAISTGSTVAAPSSIVNPTDFGSILSLAASKFNACFAAAPSVRAPTVDTSNPIGSGGPQVSSVSPACQDIVTDGTTPSGKPAFKHNGYTAGQFFYSMLVDPAMTGAKFSAPEVMAFYPANTSATNVNEQVDRAVINVRYIDSNNNPGNFITVAANYPGTMATYSRPTNWWLVGNQQTVDIVVKAVIRRVEQVKTNALASNAVSNGFQSGLQFIISSFGPNSSTYTAAQIVGPGLPTTGLWYFRNTASTQPYMDISSYRPATSTPTLTLVTGSSCSSNCPNYWFGKTSSLTATTYLTNPNSTLWSQGLATDGSFNGSSGTRPLKGDRYTVTLYNGTTLVTTLTKTLLSDLIDPKVGSQLPWNNAGTQTQAAWDATNTTLNGQLSSLTLDWVQNTAAQQISGASASTTNARAYSNTTTVPKGATSITIAPPSSYFFTSTLSTSDNYRSLLLNYRMLDSSSKSAQYTYN